MTTTIKRFKDFLAENMFEDPHRVFSNELSQKYGAEVRMHDLRGDIHLAHLTVPKDRRKQGIGTKIMDEITAHADQHQKRITLNTATKDPGGTTSRNRLVRFYKRHGFVQNKGRHADYSISASMYRRPKTVLKEMPYLLNNWKKKGTDAGMPMHSSIKIGEMGNYNIKHWNNGNTHTYSLYHKGTGKIHLEMHGRENDSDPGIVQVRGLTGTHELEVKAHDFYHHLIVHHGLTLHSDDTQSEGGMKVWHKLATEHPDIHVTHVSGDHEIPLDRTNFINNYTGLGHRSHEYLGRSHFEASRK